MDFADSNWNFSFFIVKGQHVKKQYQSSLEAGDKYLENLDYEKAEDAYLQAIKISPKEKESYEKLIQYYVDHNEIDKAKKIVKKAKKNLPKSESKKIEEKAERVGEPGRIYLGSRADN